MPQTDHTSAVDHFHQSIDHVLIHGSASHLSNRSKWHIVNKQNV